MRKARFNSRDPPREGIRCQTSPWIFAFAHTVGDDHIRVDEPAVAGSIEAEQFSADHVEASTNFAAAGPSLSVCVAQAEQFNAAERDYDEPQNCETNTNDVLLSLSDCSGADYLCLVSAEAPLPGYRTAHVDSQKANLSGRQRGPAKRWGSLCKGTDKDGVGSSGNRSRSLKTISRHLGFSAISV